MEIWIQFHLVNVTNVSAAHVGIHLLIIVHNDTFSSSLLMRWSNIAARRRVYSNWFHCIVFLAPAQITERETASERNLVNVIDEYTDLCIIKCLTIYLVDARWNGVNITKDSFQDRHINSISCLEISEDADINGKDKTFARRMTRDISSTDDLKCSYRSCVNESPRFTRITLSLPHQKRKYFPVVTIQLIIRRSPASGSKQWNCRWVIIAAFIKHAKKKAHYETWKLTKQQWKNVVQLSSHDASKPSLLSDPWSVAVAVGNRLVSWRAWWISFEIKAMLNSRNRKQCRSKDLTMSKGWREATRQRMDSWYSDWFVCKNRYGTVLV